MTYLWDWHRGNNSAYRPNVNSLCEVKHNSSDKCLKFQTILTFAFFNKYYYWVSLKIWNKNVKVFGVTSFRRQSWFYRKFDNIAYSKRWILTLKVKDIRYFVGLSFPPDHATRRLSKTRPNLVGVRSSHSSINREESADWPWIVWVNLVSWPQSSLGVGNQHDRSDPVEIFSSSKIFRTCRASCYVSCRF